MIVDQAQSHFIFVFHSRIYEGYKYVAYEGKPLTNKDYLEHWGKWLVYGQRSKLDRLAKKLDAYVETGSIACIKYDKKPLTNLGMDECVMCVYCDERCRDDVRQLLAGEGEKPGAWMYDRKTIEMWLPGGKFLEGWIQSEKLSHTEAEKVRDESYKKFSAILDHPDKPFAGWPQ